MSSTTFHKKQHNDNEDHEAAAAEFGVDDHPTRTWKKRRRKGGGVGADDDDSDYFPSDGAEDNESDENDDNDDNDLLGSGGLGSTVSRRGKPTESDSETESSRGNGRGRGRGRERGRKRSRNLLSQALSSLNHFQKGATMQMSGSASAPAAAENESSQKKSEKELSDDNRADSVRKEESGEDDENFQQQNSNDTEEELEKKTRWKIQREQRDERHRRRQKEEEEEHEQEEEEGEKNIEISNFQPPASSFSSSQSSSSSTSTSSSSRHSHSPAQPPPAAFDKDFGNFVNSNVLRMLGKMNFQGRLGRHETGIATAIEAKVRPERIGLSYGNFTEAFTGKNMARNAIEEQKYKNQLEKENEQNELKLTQLKKKKKEQQELKNQNRQGWKIGGNNQKNNHNDIGKKKYKTRAEIARENSEEDSSGGVLRVSQPKIQIIDMTGGVTFGTAASNGSSVSASAASSSSSSSASSADSSAFHQVLHNLQLLIDLCSHSIQSVSSDFHSTSSKISSIELEISSLESELQLMNNEKKLTENLLNSFNEIETKLEKLNEQKKASIFQIMAARKEFEKLKKKYSAFASTTNGTDILEKYNGYSLIFALISPIFQTLFLNWNPLDKSQTQINSAILLELKSWMKLCKTNSSDNFRKSFETFHNSKRIESKKTDDDVVEVVKISDQTNEQTALNSPIEIEKLSRNEDEYERNEVLLAAAHPSYCEFLSSILLPKLRVCFVHPSATFSSSSTSSVFLSFLDELFWIVPAPLFQRIFVEFVLPKLRLEIEKWNPRQKEKDEESGWKKVNIWRKIIEIGLRRKLKNKRKKRAERKYNNHSGKKDKESISLEDVEFVGSTHDAQGSSSDSDSDSADETASGAESSDHSELSSERIGFLADDIVTLDHRVSLESRIRTQIQGHNARDSVSFHLQAVFAVLRSKFTVLFSSWSAADISWLDHFRLWKSVFPKNEWRALLKAAIVPKLSAFLQIQLDKFLLSESPASAAVDSERYQLLDCVFVWNRVLPKSLLASLLCQSFFPNLLTYFHRKLSALSSMSERNSLEEYCQLFVEYEKWKMCFPFQFLHSNLILACFAFVLQLFHCKLSAARSHMQALDTMQIIRHKSFLFFETYAQHLQLQLPLQKHTQSKLPTPTFQMFEKETFTPHGSHSQSLGAHKTAAPVVLSGTMIDAMNLNVPLPDSAAAELLSVESALDSLSAAFEIVYYPSKRGTHNGKQIYTFGKVNIICERGGILVFETIGTKSDKDSEGKWTPISLPALIVTAGNGVTYQMVEKYLNAKPKA